jgi:hypothetical protein
MSSMFCIISWPNKVMYIVVINKKYSSFILIILRFLLPSMVTVSPMASIQLCYKYFDDNKLYLVALMYLLQV